MARTALLGVVVFLAGCSQSRQITVGSKNFTEQLVLGEIIAQHLESRGFSVDRKLNLGGTLLAHQALTSGAIDLFPEYSGTALTTVLKLPVAQSPDAVDQTVASEYRKRFGLEWLPPLGFNNTFAMVVRGDDPRFKRTLSEATQVPPFKLGVGYEFLQRPDGFPGLQKVYNLPIEGTPRSMDLGLLYRALEERQVDMAAGNSTDGVISAKNFRVLTDDRAYFPPYRAAIAVRAQTLDKHPTLRSALEQLSGKLSDELMRRLNYQVDGERRTARDVARQFLESQRLQ
jgi:glycine betaine/choline ABC-type transport system substrate-binding protein